MYKEPSVIPGSNVALAIFPRLQKQARLRLFLAAGFQPIPALQPPPNLCGMSLFVPKYAKLLFHMQTPIRHQHALKMEANDFQQKMEQPRLKQTLK